MRRVGTVHIMMSMPTQLVLIVVMVNLGYGHVWTICCNQEGTCYIDIIVKLMNTGPVEMDSEL